MRTENGTREVRALFGETLFDHPKPLELIYRSILISTEKDSLVMDFFGGSSTTAHALLKLNSEDMGNRKFILIQLPEDTKPGSPAFQNGYKNICEIGKERIRKARAKIIEENSSCTVLDSGFRVLKLDSSNMEDVFYTPGDFEPKNLSLYIDNVKPDRSPEDLLFQTMNSLGIELSAKIQEKQILNKKVFSVDDGYLLACFDESLTEDVIDEMAQLLPTYLVIRNTCVDQDSILDNFNQIAKSYSTQKEIKIRVL